MYSQLPPFWAARSTITLPAFMESTISRVISFGAGLPGISAVVTMISTSFAWAAKSSISALMNASDITLA
ncbi:Uncharacterised protein [Shigella flexneri]|nr:Uncharacterised protein [Shigella flexneri]